jgi:UDP-glucose 4,6-dehydratase
MRPEFIVNAAGYAPNPNVDACELAREEVLCANALLPQTIARVCLLTNTPWGHVSSGSIYVGAKVAAEWGRMRIERDLNHPELRRLLAGHPEEVQGFTEWDEPNFSFRHAPCNFYSGTKALAEEAIRGVGQSYIWRPRMLFNECDEARNMLSKLQHYTRVYDNVNSISHLDEFVRACLELWERQAPFGIYNVVNPGAVTTRRIVEMIQRFLKPDRRFEFWKNDEEFYSCQAKTPRSNCILDASKLLSLGVRMRPVEESLGDALERWETASPSTKFAGAGVR